jgi:nitrate/TMAO reductase-like tetraheme cytochrome c subunit
MGGAVKQSNILRGGLLAIGLLTSLPGWSVGAEAAPIAGLVPDARPAGAPIIKSVTRTPEQTAKITSGIDRPLPMGIDFLQNQGAWYTPFANRGMVSYYDLRGWHQSDAKPQKGGNDTRHLRAAYSPLHFKPAIETAKDEDCLACHREVLEDTVRGASPAGLKTAGAKAWYQLSETYAGEQDTFHRRHLATDFAKQVMDLKCNTCHQGHDPREEAPGSSATTPQNTETGFTLRKQVNPETTCLKCHGQMNWQAMGLPSPWKESKTIFQNNCLLCHAGIRTNRHQVNYLNASKIEELGAKTADTCYGCHGGRAWYRINYPYPRHAWEGMAPEVPDWAKNRPTQSEARFRLAK